MEISLQLIEAFLTVARLGSITGAARELYVTQPAMSFYIHELEARLGERLFTRNNRGVRLTEFGSKLLAEIDPIYMRFALSVKDAIARYIPPEKPPLRIGGFHYPDYMAIMQVLRQSYVSANAQASLSCEYYSSSSIRELLLCRELDLALIPAFEVRGNPDLEIKTLKRPSLYFAVPHMWNICDVPELSERPLLLEPNNSRDSAAGICRANGFEPKELRFVNNYLLLANLIEAGDGFTVSGNRLPGVNRSKIDFLPAVNDGANGGFDICAARRKGAAGEQLDKLLALLNTIDFDTIEFDAVTSDSSWYAVS